MVCVYVCVCVCVCVYVRARMRACVCVCVYKLGKQPTHQWVHGVNWGSKCQLSTSHTMGEGPGGTLDAHTFNCEPPADY